ncbi:MAG: pyridoxal phosphate-dependent aminotransferase family protein [Candidatus Eisenbacteria bacterium]|uniref:Pyridoxal phosphate-dependent aminotransferase family protein n=1 Tax=Eiseniibacteriota bacterium TaxID=2212470 RepID=A0A538T310_UNCEI|nr:MAG: pyridoxal phosphate-dependent aminotransferase family protein [Candidatus Eisenbacteria bacterium]
MDLFDKCNRFKEHRLAKAAGIYPYFLPIAENHGTEVTVDGRRIIMAGSNNYLGLTKHPKVIAAADAALRSFGTSNNGSRFLNGTLEMHVQLEECLAKFTRKEAALVYSTGYLTNLGSISALMEKGDVVVLDKDAHACIVDGARLSPAEVKRFRHNDVRDLERVLESIPARAGKLIVVDGLYSMEGDIAPLAEIVRIARKYHARLLVDDAHGFGVLGARGAGACEAQGVEEQVDLVMGTFSKSFASLGGFIAGPRAVMDYLRHHARALIFSASVTPASAAAALASLEIIEHEPELRTRLKQISDRMRNGFSSLGLDVGMGNGTPIVPIFIGDRVKTMQVWRRILDRGVFVNAIVVPAVQPGRDLLRTSYMATHEDEQLDTILRIVKEVDAEMGLAMAPAANTTTPPGMPWMSSPS